jgi:Flp pilus assembly CpaF family ATPase
MLEDLNTGHDGRTRPFTPRARRRAAASRDARAHGGRAPLVAVRSQIGAAIDGVVHVTRSVVGVVRAE